jgi:hypothetical protein
VELIANNVEGRITDNPELEGSTVRLTNRHHFTLLNKVCTRL